MSSVALPYAPQSFAAKMQSFSHTITNFKALYNKCNRPEGCSPQERKKLQIYEGIAFTIAAALMVAMIGVGFKVFKSRQSYDKRYSYRESLGEMASDFGEAEQEQKESEERLRQKEQEYLAKKQLLEEQRIATEKKRQEEEKLKDWYAKRSQQAKQAKILQRQALKKQAEELINTLGRRTETAPTLTQPAEIRDRSNIAFNKYSGAKKAFDEGEYQEAIDRAQEGFEELKKLAMELRSRKSPEFKK